MSGQVSRLPRSAEFATSWRVVLLEMAWAVPLVLAAFVFFIWLTGGFVDAWLLGFALVTGVGLVVWQSLAYRVRGVARVRIGPEAVTVWGHGGRVRRVARAELVGLWRPTDGENDRWVFEGTDGPVTLRSTGFQLSDWQELSAMLRKWKLDGDLSAVPGVSIDSPGQRGRVTVFEPHVPRRFKAGAVGMTLLGLLMAVGGFERVWNGDGMEGPWTALALALGGLVIVGAAAAAALWSARRVEFADEAVHIQVYLGLTWVVPYADIFPDAHAPSYTSYGRIDTQYGRFLVGAQDGPVVARLLREHRAWTPGSGWQRDVGRMRWIRPAVLFGMLIGGVLLTYIAARLGAAWGLTLEAGWALTLALLVASGAIFQVGIRLWARHLFRHAHD